MSVCYDMRFPELYRDYATKGVDLILVPSAFTHTTGQAHWEVLLRARAIENLSFVAAAAQGGVHPNGRRTWGQVAGGRPLGRGAGRAGARPWCGAGPVRQRPAAVAAQPTARAGAPSFAMKYSSCWRNIYVG